jgi:hypothetical protein
LPACPGRLLAVKPFIFHLYSQQLTSNRPSGRGFNRSQIQVKKQAEPVFVTHQAPLPLPLFVTRHLAGKEMRAIIARFCEQKTSHQDQQKKGMDD